MLENEGQSVPTSGTGETVATQEQNTTQESSYKPNPDRTFTRDEVSRIVKSRLERSANAMYGKYGVKSKQEFDSLLEKAKKYDNDINSMKSERDNYYRELSFMKNGVNPDKYDDINTYFKGKGQEFSEELLENVLKTHPEWLKQDNSVPTTPKTTVRPIGSQQSGRKGMTEAELADKMFGI